jgi:glycerol-3-phosphate dehydrogenase
MDIGIVGGGINGLCCALQLARQGHFVCVYERGKILNETSRASSKLLHGGLRYLENREFRLVREALRERDAWIRSYPEIAKPIRLIIPVYRHARRPGWMIGAGMFIYDYLAGISLLPKAQKLSYEEIRMKAPAIRQEGLIGGYAFSDGQMDDYTLGGKIAEEAERIGVIIKENTEIGKIDTEGSIMTSRGMKICYDRVVNIAGPWTEQLLQRSGITIPYHLDLVKGSHLILSEPCSQAFLFEVPGERRVFFVLPWKGQTLLGTTEVRQSLNDTIGCSNEEYDYLIKAYRYYFTKSDAQVISSFSGLRPLLKSSNDPNKATREYAILRYGKMVAVFGGKWTTAMALAEKVTKKLR